MVKIKLLDTLNNKTIVCDSINEAARLVGKDSSVLRLVMKNIREKGISRLINERNYIVLDGFEVVCYTAPSSSLRIEVVDTLTKKITVCETQKEAAALIGCVSSNVMNALKRIPADSPDQVSKLIKKRYTVKLLKEDILSPSESLAPQENRILIEVIDNRKNITTTSTVFDTSKKAAAFIGCSERTVVKALSIIQQDYKGPDQVSKLIKNRYRIKIIKKYDSRVASS